jgi:hypothetical protein
VQGNLPEQALWRPFRRFHRESLLVTNVRCVTGEEPGRRRSSAAANRKNTLEGGSQIVAIPSELVLAVSDFELWVRSHGVRVDDRKSVLDRIHDYLLVKRRKLNGCSLREGGRVAEARWPIVQVQGGGAIAVDDPERAMDRRANSGCLRVEGE